MTTLLEVAQGQDALGYDDVDVKIDGRRFGRLTSPIRRYQQPVPPVFVEIADKIRKQSKLLALSNQIEKQAVYEAYRSDLKLLEKYLQEFERVARKAVECSTITKPSEFDRWARDQWEKLGEQIPAIAKGPLIAFPSEMAARPEFLQDLQLEFESGLSRMISRMAYWLQMLVEQEFVGLTRWHSEDTATYHYFLHDDERYEKEVDRSSIQKVDESKPFGERITYTDRVTSEVRERSFTERHVHHIVEAKRWRLEDYSEVVPLRVKNFLDIVPDWLVPHLRIVSGDITMEEKLRKLTSDETKIEERVSVWKGSPAVEFGGTFVFAGWSLSDLLGNSGVYYNRQHVSLKAHLLRVLKMKIEWGIIFGITAVIACIWGYIDLGRRAIGFLSGLFG